MLFVQQKLFLFRELKSVTFGIWIIQCTSHWKGEGSTTLSIIHQQLRNTFQLTITCLLTCMDLDLIPKWAICWSELIECSFSQPSKWCKGLNYNLVTTNVYYKAVSNKIASCKQILWRYTCNQHSQTHPPLKILPRAASRPEPIMIEEHLR